MLQPDNKVIVMPGIEGRGMSSAKMILAVGSAIGGRNWQSELADTLGINRRTIRRWLTGEDEPRPGVWIKLLAIMRERQTHLGELIEAVERHDSRRQ
jgi:hypothetical protein